MGDSKTTEEENIPDQQQPQQEEYTPSFTTILHHPPNQPYVSKFFAYAISMVLLPGIIFVLCEYFILPKIGFIKPDQITLYAGIGAIVVVKGVSIAYLIEAFREGRVAEADAKGPPEG